MLRALQDLLTDEVCQSWEFGGMHADSKWSWNERGWG